MDKSDTCNMYGKYFYNNPNPLLLFDLSQAIPCLGKLLQSYTLDEISHSDAYISSVLNKGKILGISRTVVSLFDADSEEQFLLAADNVLTPLAVSTILRGHYMLYSGKKSFKAECLMKTFSGKELSILFHLRDVSDDSSFSEILVSLTDISKVKQLQEQNMLLSILPESNPNIIFILNCSGGFEYVNPSAKAWLEHEELADPQGLQSLLPNDFKTSVCRNCQKKNYVEKKIEYNNRIYDFKSKPIRRFGYCLITLTDITDLMIVSEERELYFDALQHSLHPAVITNTDGKIVQVNPRFEKLYGYSRHEVIGENPRILNPGKDAYFDLGMTEQKYLGIFSSMWKEIMNPEIGHWTGELPNKKKDGSIIWVDLTIVAMQDEKGLAKHFLGIPQDITDRRTKELELRLEIFNTITDLAEMRDNETGRHIVRVGRYARCLAEHLKMPKKFCDDVEQFAPLHDLGKVGILDGILLAQRKLTKDEFSIMKTHTVLGHSILKEKQLMDMASEIARYHHEHWDGTGYPDGLCGEAIPKSAQITAVVDVYDALRSARPYKTQWTHADAVKEICRLRGTQFSPEIVDAFAALEEKFSQIFDELED